MLDVGSLVNIQIRSIAKTILLGNILLATNYLHVHKFYDVLVRVSGIPRPRQRVAVLAVVPRRHHLPYASPAASSHFFPRATPCGVLQGEQMARLNLRIFDTFQY